MEADILRAMSGNPIQLVNEIKQAAETLTNLGVKLALPILAMQLGRVVGQDCGNPECPVHGKRGSPAKTGNAKHGSVKPSVIEPLRSGSVVAIKKPKDTILAPGSLGTKN